MLAKVKFTVSRFSKKLYSIGGVDWSVIKGGLYWNLPRLLPSYFYQIVIFKPDKYFSW